MEKSVLAAALAKAQAEIKAPKKTRKVDFTDKMGRKVKYNYADLADLIECIREPLSKNGLSYVHVLEYVNGMFGMTTKLMHVEGEVITSWYPLPDPMQEAIRPQEFGSSLTYARRYSLSCLLGCASEEDDDGASGADTTPPPKKPAPAGPAPVKPKAPMPPVQGEVFNPTPALAKMVHEEFTLEPVFQVTKVMVDALRARCDSSGVGRGVVIDWLGARKWAEITDLQWDEVNALVDSVIEEQNRLK